MNRISIIKPINLLPMIGFNGTLAKLFVRLAVSVWILASVVVAFFVDNFIEGVVAFVSLLFGVALAITLFSGGDYKPEKSFFFWRLSKDKMLKLYKCVTVSGVVIVILISLNGFKVQHVVNLILLLMTLYFVQKSFLVHEDVDFVANMEVSDLLGMEVDEKIQASYINYDSSKTPSKGNNIMLLTDKKLLFAFHDGLKWSLMNRFLKDIVKIGRINRGTKSYLYIEFEDRTNLRLQMCMYDKLTSNPDLFFKKFLLTLDAVVLGKTDERIASRRRVSVNTRSKPSVNINDEGVEVRSIDISSTILNNFRDATPVESGRVLEF